MKNWLDDSQLPSGSFAKCRTCNGLLNQLLELHGDLPERFPGHERRLYLWGCRRKACQRKPGSIRGIRATRASKGSAQQQPPRAPPVEPKSVSPPPPKLDLGSSIFVAKPASGLGPANPFASSSSSSNLSNPFSSGNPFANTSSLAAIPPQRPEPTQDTATGLAQTFAEKARINADTPSEIPAAPAQGPPEPWPSASSFPPPYSFYHLDADYEGLDATPAPVPQQVQVDMDIDEPATNGDKDGDKELFESNMDRAFQKFADRVAQNPDQVLRYELSGQPLLYSRDDAVGKLLDGKNAKMPRCTNCGAERMFELQLMPNAITELEADEMGIDGMEWGTIILGVCSKDCVARGTADGNVGYIEEWVGVQWEEVVAKR